MIRVIISMKTWNSKKWKTMTQKIQAGTFRIQTKNNSQEPKLTYLSQKKRSLKRRLNNLPKTETRPSCKRFWFIFLPVFFLRRKKNFKRKAYIRSRRDLIASIEQFIRFWWATALLKQLSKNSLIRNFLRIRSKMRNYGQKYWMKIEFSRLLRNLILHQKIKQSGSIISGSRRFWKR